MAHTSHRYAVRYQYPNTHHYVSTIGIRGSDFSWIEGNVTLQISLHACNDAKRDFLIPYANKMIAEQFNEMSIALMIFHKYWPEMSTANRKAIWMYLKVLVVFCEKAKNL